MEHADFVHLHTHSQYSLLDGACRLEALVRQAKDLKMPALAITDHGNMFGAIEFYREAMRQGVKPILGCEVYVAPGSRWEKSSHGIAEASFHLLLLAKDEVGYRNLIQLVTIGYLEGFYYRPRIDKEVLGRFKEGLIGLSSCLKGEIPYLILEDDLAQAERVAKEYKEILGEGNFYLELQNHGLEDEAKVNKVLLEIGRRLSLPLVATNDCHYLHKRGAQAHDVLLCIQTGSNVDDPERMRFPTDEFYLKSAEEMKALFAHLPEVINNTIEIAERCNLELNFDKTHFPNYKVPEGHTGDSYLEELCYRGLRERYRGIKPEIKERLDYELSVIKKVNYSSYFLIVWDFIRFAKQRGIPVGPGRGSVAGSLVAYVLGITNIDPLKYGLFFERCLNPERVSPPDIDIDFCYERRGEVIDYVVQKYGQANVAQIITFGTMAARGVIRDVGRVLNMPYAEVDRIAKMVPNELDITLDEALERNSELDALVGSNAQVKLLFDIAKGLEGLTRHASTHAAGVVISEEPLTNHVPLFKTNEGEITTQYAMQSIEKIGLLKMDFLGLRTLTVIHKTLETIRKIRNEEVDLERIPLDDPKTFALLDEGRTSGVFQLESAGMRDLMKKLSPQSFEDIIALLALYRPGPLGSGMVDQFIKRKHGLVPIQYEHPLLEPILRDTYGVILYQEQVMEIAKVLGGFTLGQADLLRRAMGKKDAEVMDRQRKAFLKGALERKVPERKANAIFDLMAEFAGYGFNKSHSAAYALISYQTAYLKANYPQEYMAALLTSEMNNLDKVVAYIKECRGMGIEVLPPDINESFSEFTVRGNNIRFGLAAVKNVGESTIASLVQVRENYGRFTSFYDFCEKIDLRLVNKRAIESLIKCGAFDSLGTYRSQLMEILDHTLEVAARIQKDKLQGQSSFFDLLPSSDQFGKGYRELPKIKEWPENTLLALEKETLGFYITAHPLARYEELLREYTSASLDEVSNLKDGDLVSVGGIVVSTKKITTKRNERMAFFTLEDLEGTVEVVVFSSLYESRASLIREDQMVLVKGRLDLSGETAKVIANELFPLSAVREKLTEAVHIKINTLGMDNEALLVIRKVLRENPGDCTVYLHLKSKANGEIVISTPPDLWVKPTDAFILRLKELLGEDKVWCQGR